jgi:hypothetical protein
MKFCRTRAVSTIWVVLFFAFASIARAQQDSVRISPVTIHGFILGLYRAGDPLIVDGYRLRKADLRLSGEASPHLRWRISFDAAKALTINRTVSAINDSLVLSDASIDQRSAILQDAALTYALNRALSFDIGQQIIPQGLEGTYPTAQIETIERTLFVAERSRGVGLGDVRDIGISANGSVLDGQVEYHAGVFNEMGESAGTTDANQQKAVIGRVAIHPRVFPQFQIGGTAGHEGGPENIRHDRLGGEAQYRDRFMTLRAEVMSAHDGLLHRLGWYGLGAFRPTSRLQLVGRYDWWDRDTDAERTLPNALETQVVLGASYLLEGNVAKIALNVVHQEFPHAGNVRPGTFLLAGFSGVW